VQAASGVTFEVEVDWMVIAPVAEERGYKDRCGEIVYDWYLGGLADNVTSFCKDPIQKESFVEAFGSTHRISMAIVELEEGESFYTKTKNDNGSLVILVPKDRFCSNVSTTGEDLSKTCSGDSGPMTVATRKNIADNQKTSVKHLKTIKTAAGIEFEIDIDWVKIAEAAKERGYEDRSGEIVYDWYLGGLADNVTSFCKDPIQKEAFVEAFAERKTIAFVIQPNQSEDEESKHRYDYVWVHNDSGVLQVNIPVDRFCSNVSNTGNDLSKACSGEGGMSVATRKNIKDEEKNRKKNLTRIQKATGLEFDLDVDWFVFAELAKERGYEDRIGEIIFNWYLDGLAGNLESLCKDDMCKEAVAEAAHKKVIAFQIISDDDMESKYSKCTFSDDGALVISVSKERFCSNVSNCGQDIESRL
jgi:hypothetical protein